MHVNGLACAVGISSGQSCQSEMRRTRERVAFVAEPLAVAIRRCVDAAGHRRQHQDDRHAALHRGYKLFKDWPHTDGLVLEVDVLTGSTDGMDVLVAIGELTVGDGKRSATWSGVGVGVAARMDRPLHLGDGGSSRRRYAVWKGEIAISIGSPPTVHFVPFAGLVPALRKVVVDVCDRRTADLEIQVVIVFSATMAGGNHRMGIEIDATDKRGGRFQPNVDEPEFLMLTESRMRAIPRTLISDACCSSSATCAGDPQNALVRRCAVAPSGRQNSTRTSIPRWRARVSTSKKEPRPSGI